MCRYILQANGRGKSRILDDAKRLPILAPETRDTAFQMVGKYDIDFLDAFQLVVIKRGQFRHMVGGSQTMLISADKNLALASRAEGLSAWDCVREPIPQNEDT